MISGLLYLLGCCMVAVDSMPSTSSSVVRATSQTATCPEATSSRPGIEAPAWAVPDDVADVVIGQIDFRHPFPNRTDEKGLVRPKAVAVDTSVHPPRLYVADTGNHRVLGYSTMPASGHVLPKADMVIGQNDLSSSYLYESKAGPIHLCQPVSLAVDKNGNLYVSDTGHHRVLEFQRPFETDTVADRVFGQKNDFEGLEPDRGGVSAETLAYPSGICLNSVNGDLWVADTGNHRVLCYRSPLTTDTKADLVIGQKDTTGSSPNAGGLSAGSLSAPTAVAIGGRYLVVADMGNDRILVYTEPERNNALADHVYGQDGSFTSHEKGCSPFRLNGPTSLTIVDQGSSGVLYRLLVSDTHNHRVLMFDLPPGIRSDPTALWGQGQNLHNSEPNAGGLGPSTLNLPAGLAVDPEGTLWVADQGNNRVLGFDQGIHGDRLADRVLGQVDLHHATCNLTDGLSLTNPRDIAIDRTSTPNRLYICDFDNNRILGYSSIDKLGPFTLPTLVIGQSDLFSNLPGTGRTGLFLPAAIAVDSSGSLFVVDRENNRVLWFEKPFETDTKADRVFGQPDFDGFKPNEGGVSAKTFHRPEGLAVDKEGTLFVADTRNHRILRFDRAVTTDAVADAVWGQEGRFDRGWENGGLSVKADTLSYPFGLAIRPDGLLACADTNNHRVLFFDTKGRDPYTAVHVLGQGNNYSGHTDNLGGCSARSLSGPERVLFCGPNLMVADTANCRVLVYDSGWEVGGEARYVYGQSGLMKSNLQGMGITSPRNLWFPAGIDLDCFGNIYVADREQSRVIVFRHGD